MKSDSDVDMVDSQPPQRSLAEREAFAQEQRTLRDNTLTRLESIWETLNSAPQPEATLLNKTDFEPQIWAHLRKGPSFPALSRRLGMSQAAKAVRHQYRKEGKAFSHGEDDVFAALMNYNRRVLEAAIPAKPSQSSRRSRLL